MAVAVIGRALQREEVRAVIGTAEHPIAVGPAAGQAGQPAIDDDRADAVANALDSR